VVPTWQKARAALLVRLGDESMVDELADVSRTLAVAEIGEALADQLAQLRDGVRAPLCGFDRRA
jgi:hypothetical protein